MRLQYIILRIQCLQVTKLFAHTGTKVNRRTWRGGKRSVTREIDRKREEGAKTEED